MAVFPEVKYLYKNTLERPSQVVNKLAFKFKSQELALSFKEKGNSLNWMAPLETPFILIVTHFSNNVVIRVLHWVASKLVLLK